MASNQELKHRTIVQDEQKDSGTTTTTTTTTGGTRQQMAKRGLRSLVIAISLPLSLTLLDIYLFGSSLHYTAMNKSFLYLPLWALHLASLVSAFLMGLSAWLVWASGGFHRFPWAFVLYLGQLVLGLAWDPIVFHAGASRVGLVICVALIGSLVGCIRMFQSVNMIAGNLVKPALFFALLATLVNFKLVYHQYTE